MREEVRRSEREGRRGERETERERERELARQGSILMVRGASPALRSSSSPSVFLCSLLSEPPQRTCLDLSLHFFRSPCFMYYQRISLPSQRVSPFHKELRGLLSFQRITCLHAHIHSLTRILRLPCKFAGFCLFIPNKKEKTVRVLRLFLDPPKIYAVIGNFSALSLFALFAQSKDNPLKTETLSCLGQTPRSLEMGGKLSKRGNMKKGNHNKQGKKGQGYQQV